MAKASLNAPEKIVLVLIVHGIFVGSGSSVTSISASMPVGCPINDTCGSALLMLVTPFVVTLMFCCFA